MRAEQRPEVSTGIAKGNSGHELVPKAWKITLALPPRQESQEVWSRVTWRRVCFAYGIFRRSPTTTALFARDLCDLSVITSAMNLAFRAFKHFGAGWLRTSPGTD